MTATESPLLVRRDGAVATLVLNRPERLNAFDQPMIESLAESSRALAEDDGVRCVVITGAGRAFCAGGDLAALRDASDGSLDQSLKELADVFHEAVRALTRMPKPVVAALNGVCAGGGLSLALACDLRVAAAGAKLRQAYTSNGLCIDGGGSWSLPRVVGLSKALELALLDPMLDAAEAKRVGLVAEVFEVAKEGDFEDRVRVLAQRLAAGPVGALGLAKRLLRDAYGTDLDTRLDEEAEGIAAQAGHAEGREGITAFLEKRSPRFHG